MKRLATLLTGTAIVATAMSGCDSSTGPTTVTVHDTLRIHDTTYYNDRFAGKSPIVHGEWRFATSTDTATAFLFQVGDSISASLTWKVAGTKIFTGRLTSATSMTLMDPTGNYRLMGTVTDSSKHMATKMIGSLLDIQALQKDPLAPLPSWTSVRTF